MAPSDEDLVHDALFWLGPQSRRQIGELTHLSRNRLANAVEALVDEGWVEATEARATTGGRRAVRFGLSAKRGAAVGLDIEPGRAALLLADTSPRVLLRRDCRLEPDEGPGTAMARIGRMLDDALRQEGLDREEVGAGGYSLPGPVGPGPGALSHPPGMSSWRGFGVDEHFASLFAAASIGVLNDADAMTLAVLRTRRLATGTTGGESMIVVKMGPMGIGSGVVVDGRLVTGAHGCAGEIGHIRVDPDGPLCSCGRRGCLEAVAGPSGIVRRAADAARSGESEGLGDALHRNGVVDLDDVTAAARLGDEVANRVIVEAGQAIGTVVASLVNILDPERIVVGGRLSSIGPPILAAIRQQVYGLAPPLSTGRLTIEFATEGADASLMGALLMGLSRGRRSH